MPMFADSVSRQITGDRAGTLPSLVQVENSVSSPRLLERNGAHAESEFAPAVTFDNVRDLGMNQYGTFLHNQATIDGTVQLRTSVVNNGTRIDEVAADVAEAAAREAAQAAQAAADDAANRATQEAAEGGNAAPDAPPPSPEPPQPETEPPPPPPEADAPGAPEAPSEPPPDQQPVEELPAGGCETTTDVRIDENGNIFNVVLHFNGTGWDELG